jgi:hypothetical protein
VTSIERAVILTLINYSEFLDSEGLMVSLEASGDDRTHEDLVEAFLERQS